MWPILLMTKNGIYRLKSSKDMKEKHRHPAGLLFVLLLLILFISVSLYLFAHSFNYFIFENSYAGAFLNLLSNPISAIFFGAIASVLVRSSSIIITILAAMVAAGFPFTEAIYILMGANIGTTFHGSLLNKLPDCDIYDKQRMTAITSMHYFNNVIAFCIFFPLQISTNFLGHISAMIVGWFIALKEGLFSSSFDSFNSWDSPAVIQIIQEYLEMSSYPLISLLLLFVVIALLMRLFFIVLRLLFDSFVVQMLDVKMMNKKTEEKSLLFGILASSILQSSSSTLYVLMPLIRKVSCSSRSFYPLILGINVGTCFTTIFFSLILQSKLGLTIGLAHLLYNFFALLVLTYVPLLRELPILASSQLAFCSYDSNTQDDNK